MSGKFRDCEFDNYQSLPPIIERTPETVAAAANARDELEAAIEKLYNDTH